jgi:hypothetical protein
LSTTNLGIVEIAAAQNQKEVTANDAFEVLDAALCALASFATADADVTLTRVEFATGIVLKFTGAMTALRHVILPASVARFVYIQNATTGGFGLTVEVTGVPGTTVTILASQGAIGIFSDGTNVTALANATSLQGTPVSATPPTTGQVLTYNGTAWAPATPASAGSSSILDASSAGWNEEWFTSALPLPQTSPFGQLEWAATGWGSGAQNCSIGSSNSPGGGGATANYNKWLSVAGGFSTGNGARVLKPILQWMNKGAAWQCRIIFGLTAATNIVALAGFGTNDGTSPLTWLLGMSFSTAAGNTNFMVGAGKSDQSTGVWMSTGVAADTNWHDLLITYVSTNALDFTLDGGSVIHVTGITAGIDGGQDPLSAGLWTLVPSAATRYFDCNKFAFAYTGLSR